MPGAGAPLTPSEFAQTCGQTLGFSSVIRDTNGCEGPPSPSWHTWLNKPLTRTPSVKVSQLQQKHGSHSRRGPGAGSPCWPWGVWEMMNCAGCRLVVGCTSTNCCRLRFCCWSCWSCCRSCNIRVTAGVGQTERRAHLGGGCPERHAVLSRGGGGGAPPPHVQTPPPGCGPQSGQTPGREGCLCGRVVTYAEPDSNSYLKFPQNKWLELCVLMHRDQYGF